MGTASTWTIADTNGYPTGIQVAEFVLVADATGADSASTDEHLAGRVAKVTIDPVSATMATSATLKGFEAATPLDTGTRDHFLDYTIPASEVELVFYPHRAGSLNTGAAANPTISVAYLVCDKLTVALASAAEGEAVTVRVYVEA